MANKQLLLAGPWNLSVAALQTQSLFIQYLSQSAQNPIHFLNAFIP